MFVVIHHTEYITNTLYSNTEQVLLITCYSQLDGRPENKDKRSTLSAPTQCLTHSRHSKHVCWMNKWIWSLRFYLALKNVTTIPECWDSINCYLHRRSMRISNFQGIKKNAESKHSSVTVTDSLTQFAKQLGTLGFVNVITMSAECLWRWSKSKAKSQNLLKGS